MIVINNYVFGWNFAQFVEEFVVYQTITNMMNESIADGLVIKFKHWMSSSSRIKLVKTMFYEHYVEIECIKSPQKVISCEFDNKIFPIIEVKSILW